MSEYITLLGYFVISAVNAYWTWQSLKIRNRDDTIRMLREQLELKEEAIQEMIKKKNELKRQFEHQVAENKLLTGENATYKQFHGHKHT